MDNVNGLDIKTLKNPKFLKITYCDPNTQSDDLEILYKLRNHPVVDKWIERFQLAQKLYPIDDPYRFYGFGSRQHQIKSTLEAVDKCIDIINSQKFVVKRRLRNINDTDTLNYLHHIFEKYHGLLDQQCNTFFNHANPTVRKALADLNILIHRCESIVGGSNPRHVVTYFGLPKILKLAYDDYQYFTDVYQFGSVYLNYVEIGKTLEHLAIDHDQYISEAAFRPFEYYSADFTIKFFRSDEKKIKEIRDAMHKFYFKNLNFFQKRKLPIDHPHLLPGLIPIADIDSHDESVLELVNYRQCVKSAQLI